MRKKKLIALAACAAAALALCSCAGRAGKSEASAGPSSPESGKVRVVASFEAMEELTKAVGGDRVEITVIIPDGAEPHSFEPKAQDLAALGSAHVFVCNGMGMEPWADDAVKASGNGGLICVNASDGVEPIELADGEEAKEHGQFDPHTWLSLKCAETEALNIKNALVKADPEGEKYYEENYTLFAGRLEALYSEYSEKFKSASVKTFVTGHAAFGYFCRDFGLEQKSVEDVFAEGEPSARQLAELVDYCRANGIRTIFTEALVSPRVSETLAREVGARVVPIYTIAGSENGRTYLERMEENLKAIYESLK